MCVSTKPSTCGPKLPSMVWKRSAIWRGGEGIEFAAAVGGPSPLDLQKKAHLADNDAVDLLLVGQLGVDAGVVVLVLGALLQAGHAALLVVFEKHLHGHSHHLQGRLVQPVLADDIHRFLEGVKPKRVDFDILLLAQSRAQGVAQTQPELWEE